MAEVPPLPPGFTLDEAPPLPPGFTLDGEHAEQPQPEQPGLLSRAFLNHPGETPETNNTWGQAVRNVGDAVAHTATGVTGGVASDIAGLLALMGNGIFQKTDGSPAFDPMAVRNRVAEATIYQPQNPQSLTNRVVTAPARAFGDSGTQINEWVTDKTGNPYLGHVAGAVPLTIASAMGVKAGVGPRYDARQYGGASRQAVPQPVPGTPAPPAPEPTPQQVAIQNATNSGIKLNPMQAGDKVGRAIAAPAGRAQLDRELSMSNANIVDDLAKRHIGLDPKRPLNTATMNEVRAKANKVYEEMASTGVRKTSDAYRADIAKIDDRTGAGSFADDTPESVARLKGIYANKKGFDARDAVSKIRQLRKDASKNIKADDPEQNALGYAQRQVADALDAELGRHAADKGFADLGKRYEAARVQLAKLHSVEDAIDGTNVSARLLSKQKAAGVPLSGELRAIADAYDSFNTVLQDVSKIRDHGPLSAVDYLVGVGGAATNPALAAAVLARPAARRLLASDFYQRRAIQPKGKAPEVKPTRQPNKAAAAAPVVTTRRREVR
jgi:hypothetical protein